MAAAHQSSSVAPPAALPRRPGWRDRLRARRARRHGVTVDGPVTLGRDVRFDVAPGARVVLGANVALGDGCRLHVAAGAVAIGDGAVLGERCVISVHERVTIGAGCLLADEVAIADFDHRTDDVEQPVRLQALATAPVVVGDGARIGPGAALLRGATVPAGATVGAHVVVARDGPARPTPSPPPPRPAPGGGARR